jgi:hypothetical protein
MKKIFFVLFLLAATTLSKAQLTLPQASPKAQVTQTVGLTDITIDYSSPGVKGRTIWGGLLPYDSLWRAGANAATKITFSRDVTIGGKKVTKGSYSFFIIPVKNGDWNIILNSDATSSTSEYSQSKDVIRIGAKTEVVPMRERLAYFVMDFNDNMADIAMEWEKVRVSFRVSLDTQNQAQENIKSTLGGSWRNYNAAARYEMEQKNFDTAMKYVDQSLTLSDEWYNNWTKAQLLAEKKQYTEALVFAQKAKTLGDKNPDGFFSKTQVEKALTDWKVK